MALVKRGKTWHCDFVIDDVRYRESLKTTDWREAQRKENELVAKAQAGKLATEAKRKGIARLSFEEAAEQFTADRAPNIAPISAKTERERARAINQVLGSRSVASIVPEDVLAYVRDRKAQGRSNATVNRELDIIRGVLKKAKRWHRFADEVKPLKTAESIGRALLHEEKVRLLRFAAMRPSWQSAYYASVLAFNTTCRGCELKGIQWRDVDLVHRAVTIRRSKTEAGERVIPLNADAMRAILSMYRRVSRWEAHNLTIISSSPVSTGTSMRAGRRKVGARPGGVLRKQPAFQGCDSTMYVTTRSPNWPNRKPVTRPS